MAKLEHLIKRDDGSEVKIVAQSMFGIGQFFSVGVHVLRRETPDHAWALMNDRPHPDWKTMSVDEYVKRGRSEMLRTVSHGEIFKVTNELRRAVGM